MQRLCRHPLRGCPIINFRVSQLELLQSIVICRTFLHASGPQMVHGQIPGLKLFTLKDMSPKIEPI